MSSEIVIGKLAHNVARGVYAGDAELFQRELNKILRVAKRQAVREIEESFEKSVAEYRRRLEPKE